MAAQRGGKELEEGSDRLPLVIRIKGHRVWGVTPKASSGCRHVDHCDAYRASAWRCAAAGGMSSRVAAVLSPRQPALWHRQCDIKRQA
jgi:hypothetical protein